jgi:uncharacterized heparinase superfamily protein
MSRTLGKIVNGRVEKNEEGVEFREGATVYIEAEDDDAWVVLSPEEQAEIEEAIAEADADPEGGVDAFEFLRQLREER